MSDLKNEMTATRSLIDVGEILAPVVGDFGGNCDTAEGFAKRAAELIGGLREDRAEFLRWASSGVKGCPPYTSSLGRALAWLDEQYAQLLTIESNWRHKAKAAEDELAQLRGQLTERARAADAAQLNGALMDGAAGLARMQMLDNIRRNLDEVHAEYGSLMGDRFTAVGVDIAKVEAVRAFILDFRDKLVVEYAELPF